MPGYATIADVGEALKRLLQDELNRMFLDWTNEQSRLSGLLPETLQQFEIANPSWMSAQGIYRYWHKVLHPA